MIRARLGKII
jgi:hypothetical protein